MFASSHKNGAKVQKKVDTLSLLMKNYYYRTKNRNEDMSFKQKRTTFAENTKQLNTK